MCIPGSGPALFDGAGPELPEQLSGFGRCFHHGGVANVVQDDFTCVGDGINEYIGVAVVDYPVQLAPDHQYRGFNPGNGVAEVWLKASVANGGKDNLVHFPVGDGFFFHHIKNRPGYKRALFQGEVQQTIEIAFFFRDQRVVTIQHPIYQFAFILKDAGGVEQYCGLDLLRVGGGIKRGDGSAHGVAHHVELLHAQFSQDLIQVTHLVFKPVADAQGFAAVAVAGQVDGVDVELAFELLGQASPVILVGAESVYQHQGVTFYSFFAAQVGDVQLANRDLCSLKAGAGALPANGAVVDALLGAGANKKGGDEQQGKIERVAGHGELLFVLVLLNANTNPEKSPVNGRAEVFLSQAGPSALCVGIVIRNRR